jgi:hypothetical protein
MIHVHHKVTKYIGLIGLGCLSSILAAIEPLNAAIEPLNTAKINFEEFNLNNQVFLDVDQSLEFLNVDGSGVNVTIVGNADNRIYDLFKFGRNPNATGQALIDWFWPMGSNPLGTTILFDQPVSNFSLRAGDFGSDNDGQLKITAFDSAGNVIGSDSANWNSGQFPPFATLNLNTTGINKVVYLSGGTFQNSTFIDDLTFQFHQSQTVPEPSSTLSLLALGTLGAGVTLIRKLKTSKSAEKE